MKPSKPAGMREVPEHGGAANAREPESRSSHGAVLPGESGRNRAEK
jgi:hypothetical protein